MKTTQYRTVGGGIVDVEYDPDAPCIVCHEPVVEASVGGTAICPACDMGKCHFCGVTLTALREELDGGRSLRDLRNHMKWHKETDYRNAMQHLGSM